MEKLLRTEEGVQVASSESSPKCRRRPGSDELRIKDGDPPPRTRSAKGGDVPDISRLTVGEFYFAAEGTSPRKIKTPLSLSHHPRSPLTAEEVLVRARTTEHRTSSIDG
jgi:hypothetical protein